MNFSYLTFELPLARRRYVVNSDAKFTASLIPRQRIDTWCENNEIMPLRDYITIISACMLFILLLYTEFVFAQKHYCMHFVSMLLKFVMMKWTYV